MTDRNYNNINIFDLKRIKTCEQMREERLKAKREAENGVRIKKA